MELVDTRDLKSLDSDIVPVQVRPRVPSNMNTNKEINELTINNVAMLLLRSWRLIIIVTSIFSIFAIFYSLSLKNYYTSSALLVPAQDESGTKSSLLSNMGSLASIAGITGSPTVSDKTNEAIERINSKVFFEHLLKRHPNFLPEIMAASEYDHEKKETIYDSTQYNKENGWVREVKYPFKTIPSIQESHKEFLKSFSIKRDEQSGFVKVNVVHISPVFARDLLIAAVHEINEITRLKDLSESKSALVFLQAESLKNTNKNINQSLNALVQIEMEKQMLSQISPNYVFEYIDKPFIPELKTGPNRALICIISFFAGLFLSSIFVLFKSNKFLLNLK